jgi:ubiquitin-protein ligase
MAIRLNWEEQQAMALPKNILRKRLKNEIELCKVHFKHEFEVEDPEFEKFPTTIFVNLKNIPGPVLRGNNIIHSFEHRLRIEISEEYPYLKPTARFLTEVFHPNIVPAKRGGWVCIKLLDNWDFSSNLVTFLKGIEALLSNPNPKSPYQDKESIKAAFYFLKNPYLPPSVVPTAEK